MAEQLDRQDTHSVSTSGMAIAALVLGIVALLSSVIPIVNNASFILGVIGLIFGILGLVAIARGRKGGKGVAIAGLVLNIVACVLVLATQGCYSAALDKAAENLETGGVTATASDGDLVVGASATLSNGLVVTVESIETGGNRSDGTPVTAVRVTYANEGDEDVSFNMFDWKAQSPEGVQAGPTMLIDGEDPLNSGTLVAGGTVSGTVFFDGELVNVAYFASPLASKATATWIVA